jgi:hypothetical protein
MCGSSIQMETLLRELLVEFLKILLRLGVEAGIVRACLIEFSFLVFENYFLTVILSCFFFRIIYPAGSFQDHENQDDNIQC